MANEIQAQFALLSGGMKASKDGDDQAAAAAYMIALDGASSWAVQQSVKDILKGQAEGFSKTFMPSAPELAEYCARLEVRTKAQAELIEKLLQAPEQAAPAPINPERSAKILSMVAKAAKGEAA